MCYRKLAILILASNTGDFFFLHGSVGVLLFRSRCSTSGSPGHQRCRIAAFVELEPGKIRRHLPGIEAAKPQARVRRARRVDEHEAAACSTAWRSVPIVRRLIALALLDHGSFWPCSPAVRLRHCTTFLKAIHSPGGYLVQRIAHR